MDVPLFPLPAVLCPGVALPLHIFEPRYREMVGRCLADGSPFGVILIREGRETGATAPSLASVGTMAEIREASRYSDGRFDLLAVGTQRFTLQEVATGVAPYLVGRIAPLQESVGDVDRAKALATRVSRRFVRYLELVQPRDGEDGEELDVRVEVDVAAEGDDDEDTPEDVEAGAGKNAAIFELATTADDDGARPDGTDAEGDPPDERSIVRRIRIPDDPTVLSHLMSGIIQVELPRRQALLEAGTTEARLADLDRLLDRELDLLRRRLRPWSLDRGMLAARRN